MVPKQVSLLCQSEATHPIDEKLIELMEDVIVEVCTVQFWPFGINGPTSLKKPSTPDSSASYQ